MYIKRRGTSSRHAQRCTMAHTRQAPPHSRATWRNVDRVCNVCEKWYRTQTNELLEAKCVFECVCERKTKKENVGEREWESER